MGLMSGTVLEKTVTFGQSMKNPSGTCNRKRLGGIEEEGGGCNGARCEKMKGQELLWLLFPP